MGDALKITPVLHSNLRQDLIRSYFPNGTWVSTNNFSEIITTDPTKPGEWKYLFVPTGKDETVNVHLRPGYLFPWLDNSVNTFLNVPDLIANARLSLIVNRDTNGMAEGKLYMGNGNESKPVRDKEDQFY